MGAEGDAELELFWHYCPVGFRREMVEEIAGQVVGRVLSSPGVHEAVLPALENVEVNFVDDATIGELHGQFMADPSPTDVITFQHGELFVSLDTACRCSEEAGWADEREACLYLVHGLLHLNGYEDSEEDERRRMHQEQERVLEELWKPREGRAGEELGEPLPKGG